MTSTDGVVATTARCTLRLLRAEDAGPLQRLYGDPVAMRYVGPEVEVAYELVRDHWGRGIATELAGACLAVAFGELGLARVVALSYPENSASVRVMQKIGMRDDGEFEAYGRRMVRYVCAAPPAS
jgi:hypothetical protein